jgi:hypothetical protein
MTSCSVIMPRSPWLASAGCTKNAGVPVLARVEAILLATCPDLPIPLTTVRPRQASTSSTARVKFSSSLAERAATAAASMSSTRLALSIAPRVRSDPARACLACVMAAEYTPSPRLRSGWAARCEGCATVIGPPAFLLPPRDARSA